jgi:hypothetical protein
MKKYYIYVYLDPRKSENYNYSDLNFEYEPFYVGKGIDDRYKYHLTDKRRNKLKINKITKILESGYEPIIIKLYENLTEEEAFDKEKMVIDKIGKYINNNGPLTNILDGGNVFNYSEISKDNIRKNHKTKEYREKMSKKMTGIVNITDDIKQKISKSLKSKNLKRSDETKSKISYANKNRKHSDQSRKNMSLSHIGISIIQFKYILISPTNEIYIFIGEDELAKFIKENNMSYSLIINNINKEKITIKRKTSKTLNTENWISKKEKYDRI